MCPDWTNSVDLENSDYQRSASFILRFIVFMHTQKVVLPGIHVLVFKSLCDFCQKFKNSEISVSEEFVKIWICIRQSESNRHIFFNILVQTFFSKIWPL